MPASTKRIKNWTSTTPVEESLGAIQRSLALHKARRIIFENDDDGEVVGISFELMVAGHRLTYQVPMRFEGVRAAVKQAYVGHGIGPDRLDEQTRRTACAIVKDWVLVQMAMVDSQLLKAEEVFFPYLLEDGRTAFEVFEEQLALPEPKQANNGRVNHIEEVK